MSINIKTRIIKLLYFQICFSLLILLESPCSAQSEMRSKVPDTNIDKAFITFRIGLGQSRREKRCNELFDLFDKYKGVTDEISFFTQSTHAAIPLDVFRQRVEFLEGRMEQTRKRGYKTWIENLTTVGHHNENLDNSLKGDYTYRTNIHGEVCHGFHQLFI
jgi:hypothetical protein